LKGRWGRKIVAVSSAHLSCDSQDHPPSKNSWKSCDIVKLTTSIQFCGATAMHNIMYVAALTVTLVEFPDSSNLEYFNQGNEPTVCSGGWLEVIDIFVGHFGFRESIID